jgi:hypothetical protein
MNGKPAANRASKRLMVERVALRFGDAVLDAGGSHRYKADFDVSPAGAGLTVAAVEPGLDSARTC